MTTRVVPHVTRTRVMIDGLVQGVGFRPFIYRLASDLRLGGWVENCPQGVVLEVEGSADVLETFVWRIDKENPPHSHIASLKTSPVEPLGQTRFEIRASNGQGAKTTAILPDIATCRACLDEINDPGNRRYSYPFTNCTNCGPRFSIVESLPYDRANTTMKAFRMCAQCADEYFNSRDRRFHAQPNACPRCGPHVEMWDPTGCVLSLHDMALRDAAVAIQNGGIVAIKGIGGFHLLVDARNEPAVRRLRRRKGREEKPFALMFPNIKQIEAECEVSELERRLLLSSAAPITLVRQKQGRGHIASSVAPNNPYLGVMLPYSPLHHVLMRELKFPVVGTSGNVSDEPICTDEHDVLDRLGNIADFFLVHNRPIARHLDDSIMRVISGREQVLRCARGYAPTPIHLDRAVPSTLAMGSHLKNTIAVTVGRDILLSQHIGDLETSGARQAFGKTVSDFKQLYEVHSPVVMDDAHPDYGSTQILEASGFTAAQVQHHYAHVLSCMADNRIEGPVLGIAWDGAGLGMDRTIWGGEFLHVDDTSWRRAAHFRTFRVPGGDKASREPWRSAIALLFELLGEKCFDLKDADCVRLLSRTQRRIVHRMLTRRLNSPITSSVGRLFDGLASLLGIRQFTTYEGQAAIALEFRAEEVRSDQHYAFCLRSIAGESPAIVVDWAVMILGILDDMHRGVSTGIISAKIHHTLVEIIVAVASTIGEERVILTGGCFQNRYLSERAIVRLREEGFTPYWHHKVPPNDGGIALGQAVAASRLRI